MQVETTAPPCPHRWAIAAPDGPESEGRCSGCGLTRTFRNSFPEVNEWETYHPFARRWPDLEPTPVNDVDRAFGRGWR